MTESFSPSLTLTSALENLLDAKAAAWLNKLAVFEQIDSTNSEAHRRVAAGELGNSLYVASSQIVGRGRRGRIWQSPAGSGVYMTLLWEFSGGIEELQGLSLAVGLGVTQALAEVGVSDLSLKWPNDVLFEEQKMAGILIELVPVQEKLMVIIGVGINVCLPAEVQASVERPVIDVASLTNNTEMDCQKICAATTNQLIRTLLKYQKLGFSEFQSEWNTIDAFAGEVVAITQGNQEIRGVAQGVDELGRLQLDVAGERVVISGGELSPSVRKVVE